MIFIIDCFYCIDNLCFCCLASEAVYQPKNVANGDIIRLVHNCNYFIDCMHRKYPGLDRKNDLLHRNRDTLLRIFDSIPDTNNSALLLGADVQGCDTLLECTELWTGRKNTRQSQKKKASDREMEKTSPLRFAILGKSNIYAQR